MATYTTTTFANNQPKAVHVGNMTVSGSFNLGATASSNGDVIFLCKLPQGAIVTELLEAHTTGATTQALSFGLATGWQTDGGPTYSCYISNGAQAANNRLSLLIQPTFATSLSVSDPNGYAILAAKNESGSATTSLILNWSVSYRVDQPNPP